MRHDDDQQDEVNGAGSALGRPAAPAAAGAAGVQHAMRVGATYLLAMLTESPAPGAPNVLVTNVAFQQAVAGFPLDDIVATTEGAQGEPGVLEAQAKRTLTFTAGDRLFGEVVAQLVASVKHHGLGRNHLRAAAVARTSVLAKQAAQQVLAWARDPGDAETFWRRMNTPGQVSPAMMRFLEAFCGHLTTAGEDATPDRVWALLRAFLILPFDFEGPGSFAENAALERAQRAFADPSPAAAARLWDHLVALAMRLDSNGGSINRVQLVADLTGAGFTLAAASSLATARRKLAESAQAVLQLIRDDVAGVRILRAGHIEQVDAALVPARYLEIRGASGAGKSSILKAVAVRSADASEAIVLDDAHIVGGGWLRFQHVLDCPVRCEALFADFVAGGGGLLFIDGIDQITDGAKQATVREILLAAMATPGLKVVATARLDFTGDDRLWVDEPLTGFPTATHTVAELSPQEADALGREKPAVAGLLRPDHPASALARNLFHLTRLVRSPQDASNLSEAAMVAGWWRRGGGDRGRPAALRHRPRGRRSDPQRPYGGAQNHAAPARRARRRYP